jgi:tetratricopeptide (TPR) repeat protein
MTEMSGTGRRLRRSGAMARAGKLVATSLLAALVASCAPQTSGEPPLTVRVSDAQARVSPLGQFLAGKVASSDRDTEAAARFYAAALADDPENQALLERSLFLFLAEGRIDEAGDLAQRRIAASSGAAMARLTLAVNDLADGRSSDATQHLKKMGKSGFASFMQPMLLAWSLLADGDREGALAALDELRARSAFDGFRTYHQALMHDVSGDLEEAAQGYEAALKTNARNATRLILSYGSLLTRMERWDDAGALFSGYLAKIPDNVEIRHAALKVAARRPLPPPVRTAADGAAEAFLGAAGALSREPSSESAKIYVRFALHLRPRLDAGHLVLGEILEAESRYGAANEAYARIAPDSPQNWESRIRQAVNLDRMDRTGKALSLLEEMAANRPEDSTPLIAEADILRGRERYTEASVAYGRALDRIGRLDGRHWTLLYARGITYERSKLWDEAEQDFLRALELEPDQPLVLNYLAYSWTERGVKLDEAREMIERAVEQRPNDGYIVDSLGWVYFRMGRFTEAVTHLERAVELRPEDPTINDHLGDAYWRVGRQLEARFQWSHAIALGAEKERVPAIESKLARGLPALPATVKDG